MLPLLMLLSFLTLVTVAHAEDLLSPTFSPSMSPTIIRPLDNMAILYDGTGQSTTILQSLPGLSWYSQEDRFGRITNQGYLFDPFGPREPLQVPSVDRYAPERDRYTR